jgi:hypothetical protein
MCVLVDNGLSVTAGSLFISSLNKQIMYIKAKLAFDSYMPDVLKPGMWFKQTITETIYAQRFTYDRLFLLGHKPADQEAYIQANGCPVMPVIVSITANPDEKAAILAEPHQIGWFDDGPGTDELRDIELKDINTILENYDGELDIEIEDLAFEDGLAVPILYMDKVTLRLVWDEDDYLYEQDDYPEDEDEYEEEWDEMDDNTNDEPE